MRINKFGLSSLRGLNIAEVGEVEPELGIHSTADINIFIGRNGAGKSTVLDAIDSTRSVQKLAHLKRENTHHEHRSKLQLNFDDAVLHFEFLPIGSENTSGSWINSQHLKITIEPIRGLAKKYSCDIEKFSLSTETQKKIEDVLNNWGKWVRYYEPVEELNLNLGHCAEELWALGKELFGLIPSNKMRAWKHLRGDDPYDGEFELLTFSQPVSFKVVDSKVIAEIFFADDPSQPSRVPLELFPSGWKAYIQILSWLRNLPEGSICLLEEPESHLHHALQRSMSHRIQEITYKQKLQLFIATHSPIFINMQSSGSASVNIFESVDDADLRILKSPHGLLRELGILASDVLLANGIVWVEGASDRIYLNHWISQYCTANKINTPLERTHFAICLYGGASLVHFEAGHDIEADLIDMFALSHNAFVVMDKDLDFDLEEPEKTSKTKRRIAESLGDSVWITQQYTIESYLPMAFRKRYFKVKAGRLVKKTSHSKVNIARLYVKEHPQVNWSELRNTDLWDKIGVLVSRILLWNKM